MNSVETAKFRNTVSCLLSPLPTRRGRPVAQEDIMNSRAYVLCHLEARRKVIMRKKNPQKTGRLITSMWKESRVSLMQTGPRVN